MKNEKKTMEEIISLAKRKGFVYPGSEIYGGLGGAYDFGPLGVELLNNIKQFWWKKVVQDKEDYYGVDSAMFRHPKVWEASGHTTGFSDPMAECKNCNTRLLELAYLLMRKCLKKSLTSFLKKTLAK